MKNSVQKLVERKKNELHEKITIPVDQAERERDLVAQNYLNEPLIDRYRRLADEKENLYGNILEAEQYMLKIMNLNEGDAATMLVLGRFYLRNQALLESLPQSNAPNNNNNNSSPADKADEYLRDAYSFQIKNLDVALTYATYLI